MHYCIQLTITIFICSDNKDTVNIVREEKSFEKKNYEYIIDLFWLKCRGTLRRENVQQ